MDVMKKYTGSFFVSDGGNTTVVVKALLDAYGKVYNLNPQYIPTGGRMQTGADGSSQPVPSYHSGRVIDCINGTQLALVHEPASVPRTTATGSEIENPRLVEIFAPGIGEAKKIMTFFETAMLERGFAIGMTPEGLMEI